MAISFYLQEQPCVFEVWAWKQMQKNFSEFPQDIWKSLLPILGEAKTRAISLSKRTGCGFFCSSTFPFSLSL